MVTSDSKGGLGKGVGPRKEFNIHEDRISPLLKEEEDGALKKSLLKFGNAYRKSRLAFCFLVEHNILTL